MDQDGITTLIFSVVLVFMGLCHLSGIWHEEGKERFGFLRRWSIVMDPDLIFGKLHPVVVLGADLLGFWVSIGAIPLVVATMTLCHFFPNLPNPGGFFEIFSIGGSWIGRGIYIVKYKKLENPPLLWPYKRL